MNQVARVTLPNLPSVAGASRPAKGGRSLALSSDADPIDALSPQPGISYNDAALAYEDKGRGSSGRRDNFSQPAAGGFNAPSQSFAAMFEGLVEGQSGTVTSGSGQKFINVILPKAIGIYEATARTINGTEKDGLGSSLSITL